MDQLIERNALSIGMDMSVPNYTLGCLGCAKYPPSIAQIHAKCIPVNSCNCVCNHLTNDSMHWCMEMVGGRFVASTASLLVCPYDHVMESLIQAM